MGHQGLQGFQDAKGNRAHRVQMGLWGHQVHRAHKGFLAGLVCLDYREWKVYLDQKEKKVRIYSII